MTRRELFGLSLVPVAAVAGVGSLAVVTTPPALAYEAITPICAGCGSDLLRVGMIRQTHEPQRVMCASAWCEHYEKEIRVPLFRKLA